MIAGADSKALVWTREPEFTDFGLPAATDWDSFMALADSDRGRRPDPVLPGAGDAGGADGWPATDWVEMVVLRTGGPDFYDSWIRHEVPFDDPVVVDAIRTVGEMVHRPGYLDISPAATSLRDFGDALPSASPQQPAACLMTPFPSFMPGVLDADDDLAVGTFAFPTFGAGFDDAVVGGGALAVAVTDRPEVRTFMAALASPDWGVGAAQLDWPLLLPANARFDTGNHGQPGDGRDRHRNPGRHPSRQLPLRRIRLDAHRGRPAPSSTAWSGCSAKARPTTSTNCPSTSPTTSKPPGSNSTKRHPTRDDVSATPWESADKCCCGRQQHRTRVRCLRGRTERVATRQMPQQFSTRRSRSCRRVLSSRCGASPTGLAAARRFRHSPPTPMSTS